MIKTGEPRETRVFNGRTYLLETAITGDVGILRAYKADAAGNCVFRYVVVLSFIIPLILTVLRRYTTKAFGPLVAKAATLTIVEAENIVPVGSLDPSEVHLPGMYVDRVVPATAEKQVEILKLRSPDDESAAKTPTDPKSAKRSRIAKRAAKELKQGYYVNLGVGEFMSREN